MKQIILIVCVVMVSVLISTTSTNADITGYTVTDIGAMATTADESSAFGINNSGQVVGYAKIGGLNHPVLWTNGTILDLPRLSDNHSITFSINDSGQAVGSSYTPSESGHPVLWDNGSITDLGHLGSGGYGGQGGAHDINNDGAVVGYSWLNTSENHAFLWSNGDMVDLGSTVVGQNSSAYAINDSGQVVGVSAVNNADHACLWSQGTATLLDDPDTYLSFASDINDSGQVVGWSSKGGVQQAFIWEGGVRQDLGTFGQRYSRALAINNSGQILGMVYDDDVGIDHFLWSSGEIIYVNDLLPDWSVRSLNDINDAGEIVGQARYLHDGLGRRAVLLTPIPEPATLTLLAMGGLALVRRRKRGMCK